MCVVFHRVAESHDSRDQTRSEESIKGKIKNIPETKIVPSHLPEFRELISQESECENIEEDFSCVQVSGGVDSVDSASVEC